MNVDPTVLGIAGLMGFGALVTWFVKSSHARRAKALSREFSGIGTAKAGKVMLMGRVVSNETLESPVSHKPCLYLRVLFKDLSAPGEVEPAARTGGMPGRRQHVRATSPGHRVDIKRQVERLWLEDETGKVELNLKDADFELKVDRFFKTGALSTNDPEVVTLMRKFGAFQHMSGSVGKCTLTEVILEPNDRVVVNGNLTVDGVGNMCVTGTTDDPLFITDRSPDEVAQEAKQKALSMSVAFWVLLALTVVLLAMSFLTADPRPATPAADDAPVRPLKDFTK